MTYLLGFIVGTLFGSAAWAADIPVAEAESVGLSSERLTRLESYMNRQVDGGELAGIQVLIARHGKIAFFNSVGMADAIAKKPIDDKTIFAINSMTKPVTSVATMMLYEQGHFLLTDPIGKYLPELADMQVYVSSEGDDVVTRPPSRAITIQDLLRNTAGMTYFGIGQGPVADMYGEMRVDWSAGSAAQYVESLAKVPLIADPGVHWEYSGATNVLVRLIEVITGGTFDDYLRQNIFASLDMNNTAHYVPPEKASNLSATYEKQADGSLKQVQQFEDAYGEDHAFKMGDSGLTSTALDYFRFAQMLLNGGTLDGNRILGPRTVALTTKDHLTPDMTRQWVLQPGHGFGLGVDVLVDPIATGTLASPGTYFWMGGQGAVFWVDPKERLVVVAMMQISPPLLPRLRGELEALIYQAIID